MKKSLYSGIILSLLLIIVLSGCGGSSNSSVATIYTIKFPASYNSGSSSIGADLPFKVYIVAKNNWTAYVKGDDLIADGSFTGTTGSDGTSFQYSVPTNLLDGVKRYIVVGIFLDSTILNLNNGDFTKVSFTEIQDKVSGKPGVFVYGVTGEGDEAATVTFSNSGGIIDKFIWTDLGAIDLEG